MIVQLTQLMCGFSHLHLKFSNTLHLSLDGWLVIESVTRLLSSEPVKLNSPIILNIVVI